jgi:hypothetical protein
VAVQVGTGHGDLAISGGRMMVFLKPYRDGMGHLIFGQTRCVFFFNFQIGGCLSILTFNLVLSIFLGF